MWKMDTTESVFFDMALEENAFLKLDLFNVKSGPSSIVKEREKFGEFATLYETIRSQPDKFHGYTRMSVSTFDYILKKIELRLKLNDTNFHCTISPAEKLIVTLRWRGRENPPQFHRDLRRQHRITGQIPLQQLVHEDLKPYHQRTSAEQNLLQRRSWHRLYDDATDTVPVHSAAGVNGSDKGDEVVLEYQYDYETFTLKEDTEQYQLNFQSTLSRLLDVLENSSIETDFDETPCEQWMDCRDTLQQAFLGSLPACPCHYPSGIFYEDKVWDAGHDQHFRWRDASGERLDVYKPGAEYCIRSLLAQDSTTLAAQHCCYDMLVEYLYRRLITRGLGAGNPNFVSPDVSAILHDKIDILPWRLCKGDFTRYNRVRPPNNDNNCKANPEDEEFNHQVQTVKFF